PPAMGPYSHAVAAGELLFVSGQGPVARDGSGVRHGTIEEETRLTLDNLKAILEDAGSSLAQVVKTTCYLADMGNFARFNEVYKTYFPEQFPARTTIQAARLPGDIQVEIEAIAVLL
ncbi:MAG: reactive intermediate/imine deaminase, partial [Candidatus Hydrogenedentes bacterium]|nr:reactive intermediate/imine deaminase [Candidatus Hydrogenedentota bacterium]